MWRVGIAAVLVLAELSFADIQYGNGPIQSIERLKRSPRYYEDCPPPYYHHHHAFWPPPPRPPPYWPPPPQREEINFPQEQDKQAYTDPTSKPCCGQEGASNAVSNAKSDTGSAVAIAIARSKPPT